MADVNRRADRGQLILITALLVAVTMVALVMLLNTAIYTDNLASRGLDPGGREAIEYRGVLEDEATRLFVAENGRDHGTWNSLRDTTRESVLLVDNYTARNHARTGSAVGVDRSTLVLTEGRLVRQTDDTRPFTGASDATDWEVASNVDATRNFTMTVTASDLNETTDATAHSDGAFRVNLDGGAWIAYVYRDEGTGNVTVATNVSGAGTDPHCSVSAAEATVNLSAGTLDGTPCADYAWAEGVSSPYTVRFEHGANATGTYNLTVAASGGDMGDLNAGGPTSPFHRPAIYSLTFDVFYESPTVAYQAPIRVAPGEPA